MTLDFKVGGDGPGVIAEEVTPNDSADLTVLARGIYIGGAGNLAVHMRGEEGGPTVITFIGLVAGTVYPIAAQRVMSTGTTATNIVALA